MATKRRRKSRAKKPVRLSRADARLVLRYWSLGRPLDEFLVNFPELDQAAVELVWARADQQVAADYDHQREERLALARVTRQLADLQEMAEDYDHGLELYHERAGIGLPANGSLKRFKAISEMRATLARDIARLEELQAKLRRQLGEFDGAIKGVDTSRPAAVVNIYRGAPDPGDEPEGRGGVDDADD